jgi:predicted PurR-regulated permease PerM
VKEILGRINQNLLFIVLLVITLYYGKVLLVPVIFGVLVAMLMAPVCRALDNRGFHRALSSAICVLILVVVIAGVSAIVIAEINSFTEDMSLLEAKGKEMLRGLQKFIQSNFKITPKEQITIAKEQVQNGTSSSGGIAGNILTALTSTIGTLILMLVYCFLFLFSKEKYESFFVRFYHEQDADKVRTIVDKISQVSQKYLTGRAMSVLILATLYSIALLIIGVENAILLAGIAAVLTIIPYVGSTLGGMFPFIMALITEDSLQPALMVAGSIILIQTIDNYFIEPNVVGGEVGLSALASIMSIIIGGVIWGVAGMILFLPMFGIFKIICDHVEELKPIGYLLGDASNGNGSKLKAWVKEKFKF